jgi:hypothetical protein
MAHPYHHSLSSVRKWGGSPFDYLPLHSWFDLMWTGKSFFSRYSAEVVVPVVHRRGPAGRVARIDAQAERTAGRCLWTHRGDHRAVCHISYSPALRMGMINGRELRVAPQFEFPLWVDCRHSPSGGDGRPKPPPGHGIKPAQLRQHIPTVLFAVCQLRFNCSEKLDFYRQKAFD